MKSTVKTWAVDTGIRAVKTGAQTAVAALGVNATGLLTVPWSAVGSLAGLAMVTCVLQNLASLNVPAPSQPDAFGLPHAPSFTNVLPSAFEFPSAPLLTKDATPAVPAAGDNVQLSPGDVTSRAVEAPAETPATADPSPAPEQAPAAPVGPPVLDVSSVVTPPAAPEAPAPPASPSAPAPTA